MQMDERASRRVVIGGAITVLAGLVLQGEVQAAQPTATSAVSPDVALSRLQEGNRRFVKGALANGNLGAERRLAFAEHQAPFASVLSCSDSRVSPELIFDQHIGDLFVVRVAGNFADTVGLGTLEYGYSNLNAKLIVILGHEGCGAIKATVDAIKSGSQLPPHLNALQAGIEPGIKSIAKTGSYEDAVLANVRAQVLQLSSAGPVLAAAVARGDLRIVGAEYTLLSGEVTVLT